MMYYLNIYYIELLWCLWEDFNPNTWCLINASSNQIIIIKAWIWRVSN